MIVVTGGAGFIGSHLCRALSRREKVVAIDHLLSGSRRNVADLAGHPSFELVHADVAGYLPPDRFDGAQVHAVCHLASPASPADYLAHPLDTLWANSTGTRNALEIARWHGCRFLLASTSEVYGDPSLHPQPEAYWGNVNPVGPRSVYDEGKRFGEALTAAYGREYGLDVRIARIFNTYGPGLRPDDGRVVSTFIRQALAGEALTVQGDGSQTRSFCYVDDLVAGLVALLDREPHPRPVNLGNPEEVSVLQLAGMVLAVCGKDDYDIEWLPMPQDDPVRRCPDVSLARRLLGWEPRVGLLEGLSRTVEWFRTLD